MSSPFALLVNDLHEAGLLHGTVEDCLDSRTFVHLFDDNLPVCTRWIPSGNCLSLDACVEEIGLVSDAERELILETMLRINALAMHGEAFSLLLDSNDIVILSRRVAIDGMTVELLCTELDYVVRQCSAVREALQLAAGIHVER